MSLKAVLGDLPSTGDRRKVWWSGKVYLGKVHWIRYDDTCNYTDSTQLQGHVMYIYMYAHVYMQLHVHVHVHVSRVFQSSAFGSKMEMESLMDMFEKAEVEEEQLSLNKSLNNSLTHLNSNPHRRVKFKERLYKKHKRQNWAYLMHQVLYNVHVTLFIG